MIKFKILNLIGTVNEDGDIIFDPSTNYAKNLAKDMQAALESRILNETDYQPGTDAHMLMIVPEFAGEVLEFDPIVAPDGYVN